MNKTDWETWKETVMFCQRAINDYKDSPRDRNVIKVSETIKKLEAFVMYIARDYVELSHDKVRWQRDDYIKRARELLNELYEEE